MLIIATYHTEFLWHLLTLAGRNVGFFCDDQVNPFGVASGLDAGRYLLSVR